VNSQLRKTGKVPKNLEEANLMFGSLRRNIKYMAVYPNMFLMAYFIAHNKAPLEVNTWFGSFKIDHTTIINAFMDGNVSPWFRFGNDELPLSKIELLYAYYFALRNGSFETYQK